MVQSVTPAGRLSKRSGGLSMTLAGLALSLPVLVAASWTAVHRIEGLGPWVADSLRSVVGTESVARLEDAAYAVEDRFNRYWHRGETPKAHWKVPAGETSPSAQPDAERKLPQSLERPPASTPVGRSRRVLPVVEPLFQPFFQPADVGPMHESWSAPGDGQWLPLSSTSAGTGAIFKTLLHPDANRSWAELFIVAIDLRRVRLHLVAGTREPEATLPEALAADRPGVIPRRDLDSALAAFNGGFKTEHGRYGMRAGGLTLVPENPAACTISYGKDHELSVGSWENLRAGLATADWWRQTPNCMFEKGVIHPRLAEGYVNQWGATLSGRTVIRRSALGVDPHGNTLFVAISNHTTAPALARGMRHAGAVTVAQLDVNHSYPKFVTFHGSESSALRFAVPLAEGFEYSEHEYLSKPSRRDFFYLTPRRLRTAQTRGTVH